MMHPACKLCRGACCESIYLPLSGLNADGIRWFLAHGKPMAAGVELECACLHLRDGRCSIYETRPDTCNIYQVGGEACQSVIRRRRQNWREIEKLFVSVP